MTSLVLWVLALSHCVPLSSSAECLAFSLWFFGSYTFAHEGKTSLSISAKRLHLNFAWEEGCRLYQHWVSWFLKACVSSFLSLLHFSHCDFLFFQCIENSESPQPGNGEKMISFLFQMSWRPRPLGFLQQHTMETERGQLCPCPRILSVKGKIRLCGQTPGFKSRLLHLELMSGRFSLSESQAFWLANCREPQHRPAPEGLYEDKTEEILRSIPVTS